MSAGTAHAAAVLMCCSAMLCAAERPARIVTEPACKDPTPHVSLPVSFEDRVVVYWSFDRPGAGPEIDRVGIKRPQRFTPSPDGIRGGCLAGVERRVLTLTSVHLSPHRAMTVSFWWALARDPAVTDGFSLLAFHGGGRSYVSHFSRGKGPWCALRDPTAVFQVYNFGGIRNVNGLYDRRLSRSLELKRGHWHHTAITVAAGRRLTAYTNGRPVYEVFLQGRAINADDGLNALTLGSRAGVPVHIDELIVLDRVLGAHELGDYYEAITQMHEVDYPLR